MKQTTTVPGFLAESFPAHRSSGSSTMVRTVTRESRPAVEIDGVWRSYQRHCSSVVQGKGCLKLTASASSVACCFTVYYTYALPYACSIRQTPSSALNEILRSSPTNSPNQLTMTNSRKRRPFKYSVVAKRFIVGAFSWIHSHTIRTVLLSAKVVPLHSRYCTV